MDNIIPLLRRRNGVKQCDLARTLNVSPSFLCKVEKGIAEPTGGFMTLCASFFNETVETVFPCDSVSFNNHFQVKSSYNNIWSIRQKKNIKQNRLADMLGCSPSYLSKVEKGIQYPNEHFRKKCARILKTKETELFPETTAVVS